MPERRYPTAPSGWTASPHPKNTALPPFCNGCKHLLRPDRSETGSSAKIPRRGFVSTVLHAAWCRAIRTPDERTIGTDKHYRKRSSRKTAASGAVFAKDRAQTVVQRKSSAGKSSGNRRNGDFRTDPFFLNFIININRSLLIISWFITE